MAKFAIGEIAVIAAVPDLVEINWSGREVEIISAPYVNIFNADPGYTYNIRAPWLPPPPWHFGPWCAHETTLLKRRPPPDWESYSNPQDVPTEELA